MISPRSLWQRVRALANAPQKQIDGFKRIEDLFRAQLTRSEELFHAQLARSEELLVSQQARTEEVLHAQLEWHAQALSRQTDLQMQAQQIAGNHQHDTQAGLAAILGKYDQGLTPQAMVKLSHHFHRNFLSNDDAVTQKALIAIWRMGDAGMIGQAELWDSGFRTFSQNDEDGILLRIFSKIGTTNRCAVEIGSNCNGSELGIPENLSANLIINHGWHGIIIEMDPIECSKMRHFFARDHATRHYHIDYDGDHQYYSPTIVPVAVSPANINDVLSEARCPAEPDLFILDIDGGDYAVMEKIQTIKPRVIVVEFEKRFRGKHRVVQFDRQNFSQRWAQSGAASLMAWEELLRARGYALCAIGACGFNAFFVEEGAAAGKMSRISASAAFDTHPVFSSLPEAFWLVPDDSWQQVG